MKPGTRPSPSVPEIPPKTLVGLGFCLKPVDPECPSGRANHLCAYLEGAWHLSEPAPPEACQGCPIRDIGLRALSTGCALYIMTSARDILFDVLLPTMEARRFEYALLALCRYSFEPFRIALAVAGLKARLFAFESGDCADYRMWLLADRGTKQEQTCFCPEDYNEIKEYLGPIAESEGPDLRRDGNVFFTKAGGEVHPT